MTERDWERLYLAAVMETDWLRIEERIEAVESAISQRLQENQPVELPRRRRHWRKLPPRWRTCGKMLLIGS
jgi:hypothetical protein